MKRNQRRGKVLRWVNFNCYRYALKNFLLTLQYFDLSVCFSYRYIAFWPTATSAGGYTKYCNSNKLTTVSSTTNRAVFLIRGNYLRYHITCTVSWFTAWNKISAKPSFLGNQGIQVWTTIKLSRLNKSLFFEQFKIYK